MQPGTSKQISSVPVLAASAEPILEFERRILDSMTEIEHWFRQNWQEHTPPFYGSVDLRNSGFKLAPVDMNLFPGGFNNLSEDTLPCAVQAAQVAIERTCPDARRLLLIPERHTRNVFYLQNVARLVRLLATPGLEVRVGSLSDEVTRPTTISLPGGERLTVEPVIRQGERVGLEGFDPCIVLLNNDLSAGIPPQLTGLDPGQTLLPPLHAGWAVRRKSNFFQCYDEVAAQFAQLIGVDPWTINPLFVRCGKIDFREKAGEECLSNNVDRMLGEIRERYRERDIRERPFVIVKPDAGTYGMGIMTVRDASEVVGLNRKERKKMAVVKEGLEVSEVIIQEGVPTYETVDQAVAEPVVYMIDRYVIGGFYRVHRQRGIDENLNAPGMEFVPLAFPNPCNLPNPHATPGSSAPNRFYCYGVIGRLALLAASIELERTADAAAASLTPSPSPTGVGEGRNASPVPLAGDGTGVRVGATS
jgi:glutamate--cysteine ligase